MQLLSNCVIIFSGNQTILMEVVNCMTRKDCQYILETANCGQHGNVFLHYSFQI